jgi:hypothetical protein
MHNLIWIIRSSPRGVLELLRVRRTAMASAKKLRAAISNRITYYVRDRAINYSELDVLNESLHNMDYRVFRHRASPTFTESVSSSKEAGVNPVPLLMTNEFNVLQWSRPYPFKTGRSIRMRSGIARTWKNCSPPRAGDGDWHPVQCGQSA